MGYLTDSELRDMGFKSLGKNVKISDKASIYNADQLSIGDFSRIDDFCVISGNINIGRYVHITPFCLLAGGEKGIIMEDFTTLAYRVQVFTQSDDYTGETLTNSNIPSEFKKEFKKEVILRRHVIVGAGSTIFPGVEVAERCSIGAVSLVNKGTLPWGIYLGVPARRLKERKKNLLELERQFLQGIKNDSI